MVEYFVDVNLLRQVVHESFGITDALMTTVHATTATQKTVPRRRTGGVAAALRQTSFRRAPALPRRSAR